MAEASRILARLLKCRFLFSFADQFLNKTAASGHVPANQSLSIPNRVIDGADFENPFVQHEHDFGPSRYRQRFSEFRRYEYTSGVIDFSFHGYTRQVFRSEIR